MLQNLATCIRVLSKLVVCNGNHVTPNMYWEKYDPFGLLGPQIYTVIID